MTPTTDTAVDPESAEENGKLTLWPLAVIIALVLVVFWDNLHWLVRTWSADEFYNHGFLIPIISGYLIYRKWAHLKQLPRVNFYGGIAVILASVSLHLVATYLDVHFPSTFALIGVMTGLVWWLWGWQALKEIAFPLVFLVFMVPLGKLLIDQVAQPMQLFGAKQWGGAAQFLGMPTTIDGISLQTPEYSFEVAVACSGLKSAIAMLALGALLAYLVEGVWWKKIVIFLASLPVAILANATRIWLTLVPGRALGEKAAEAFLSHFLWHVGFSAGIPGAIWGDKLTEMRAATGRYIAAAVLLVASVVAVRAIRHMRVADAGYMPDFKQMPERVGEYMGHEMELSETVVNFLHPDAMRSVEYRSPSSNPPWLTVSVIYGKDWRPIHSPLHCFAADGWAIGTQEEITIEAPDGLPHQGTLVAKRLHAVREGAEVVALYVLAYPGGTTASWPRFAYKVATGPGGAGGVILLLQTPVTGGDREKAKAAASKTMAEVYPACVRFWYEDNGTGQ